MMALGRWPFPRAAARVVREAGDATKTKALGRRRRFIRAARKAEILAANARQDIDSRESKAAWRPPCWTG